MEHIGIYGAVFFFKRVFFTLPQTNSKFARENKPAHKAKGLSGFASIFQGQTVSLWEGSCMVVVFYSFG